MKSIFTIFILLFLEGTVSAQAPQAFNYQAIARDASGNVLSNKPIGLQLSVLDGSPSGGVLYAETFALTTNQFGLFTTYVGTGTVVSGNFSSISWAVGDKYLKTDIDPNGGNNYTISGATQLLSVPFALYSNTSGSSGNIGPWSANGSNIFNTNTGYVGVGTNVPRFSLDLYSTGNAQMNFTEGIGGRTATISRYTNRMEIQPSDAFQVSVGGVALPHFWVGNGGFVGIGTTTPSTILNVNGGDITVDNTNSYIITNSTVTNNYCGVNMRVQGNPKAWMYWDNSNSVLNLNTAQDGLRSDLIVNASGNIGIGTSTPADKLSVTGGYVRDESANPFFLTNATVAGVSGGFSMRVLNNPKSWVYWNDGAGVLQLSTDPIAARTDFTINSLGNIGIGTNSPSAPLDVEGSIGYIYNTNWSAYTNSSFRNEVESIHSVGDILAQAFVAFSDARIKHVLQISNSAKDLKILNSLKVTDYVMKDRMLFGDKRYKKVIAQQVEKVYPQIVNQVTEYIPNIYQFCQKITKTNKGYLLAFTNKHNVSKNAKKVKLQDNGAMKQFDVLSIPTDYELEIMGPAIQSDTLFVYGEQVNDFRTVDYEGLTTLNISATQQLNKLVQQQQAEIAKLIQKVESLEKLLKK